MILRAIHAALRLADRGKVRAFAEACRNPEPAQALRLRRFLEANASTAYGRAHDYASIRSVRDFQAQMPVLTPEALAAAGISPQSGAIITLGAYTHLATTHTAWRTTIEDQAEARQRIDPLTQRIRRGEREYLDDLAQAKADLAEAQSIETTLLHQLRTTIGTNITENQWQTIARFHTNRRTLSIPAPYAGVEWDGGSWKAARTAIHAVQSAQRQGITPCSNAVGIVADLQNDGQLAQCIYNVHNLAPAIAASIEQQLVNLQLY